MTLGDMLRHERSGAGMEDQRNLDAELARAITTDGKFEVRFLACVFVFRQADGEGGI